MTLHPDGLALRALCAAATVVVLVGMAGMALGMAWAPRWTGAATQEPERTPHAGPRCPHCGWIESKREVVLDVMDPRALRMYEYTVRKVDGSSSVFVETLPVSWRLGERLLVIDGTGPRQ